MKRTSQLESKGLINHDPNDTFKYTVEPAEGNLTKLPNSALKSYIQLFLDTLTTAHYIPDNIHREEVKQEVDSFYQLNDHKLFWLSYDGPSPKIKILQAELLNASAHGLNSEDYNISKLINYEQQVFSKKPVNAFELMQLDVRLSIAYLSYGYHLKNGRIKPIQIDKLWSSEYAPEPVAHELYQDDIQKALKEMAPKNENYESLQKALAFYKAIQVNGEWSTLPEKTNLRLGDSSVLIPQLKQRLVFSNDLAEEELKKDSIYFSEALESAVKRFQSRNGLTTDGIVGKGTVQVMNIPLQSRIDQIKLNLERMRWMPSNLGNKFIYVNIPAYELFVFDDGDTPVHMRVITGETDHATPVLTDRLTHLVFSPTWTIPKKIIQNEMLHRMKTDSTYLTRNGYELYEGWNSTAPIDPTSVNWDEVNVSNLRVVQKPGRSNALGLVKFPLTNDRSIYLHDTPSDYLFTRDKRAFSHGCVRLEQPDVLAEYLLKDQNWDNKKVREYMEKGEPATISLNEEIPVFLVYRTCWVDKTGLVNFRKDIYNIDDIQLVKLRDMQKQKIVSLF
ncbi:L,D-transpeptidase family protein [Fulvivirga maritima]|uniref:L,D-transpeptidase family protein n=1 Tax=Fulvivirga maritima TaxID=2904247 RepID=UPI001EFFB6C7|nr:L,D-transpeptidase family protein [Fulvivirga maritima]UII27236.1 L,D-transpeptidase family protein [Fulvivirga maritima]